MNWLKPLLTYFVYPAAKELAVWIYNKYLQSSAENKHQDYKKKKAALKKSIKEATDDEQIKQLSIILRDLEL